MSDIADQQEINRLNALVEALVKERDALRKSLAIAGGGNRANGVKSGAKLTEAQAREILASREPGVVLAQRYGVSSPTIGAIRHRKIWRWL